MEIMPKEITALSLPFIPGWEVSGNYRGSGHTDFEAQVFPFVNRLYRTALILTGSPRAAKNLLHDIFLKLRHEHPPFHNDDDFGLWMFRILFDAFASNRHSVNRGGEIGLT